MVGFITFLFVIICIMLLTAILMQSGKGGGLADGFSSAENLLGTQTNMVMVKVTAVLVTLFIAACLVIACLSSTKERSLMTTLPDRRQPATVNIDKIFNQTPAQTITINADAPAAEAKVPATANAAK